MSRLHRAPPRAQHAPSRSCAAAVATGAARRLHRSAGRSGPGRGARLGRGRRTASPAATGRINTGNGYYGGLQFSQGTWAGLRRHAVRAARRPGHPGSRSRSPSASSAGQGVGAWPVCGRRLTGGTTAVAAAAPAAPAPAQRQAPARGRHRLRHPPRPRRPRGTAPARAAVRRPSWGHPGQDRRRARHQLAGPRRPEPATTKRSRTAPTAPPAAGDLGPRPPVAGAPDG